MVTPKYKLLFSKEEGEFGRYLKLFKNGILIDKWSAVSGQEAWQGSHWDVALSPIPPSNEVSIPYKVLIIPEDVPIAKQHAMGQWFFPVLPRIIKHKRKNFSRSYIGIHEDANAEYAKGSAGCIVLPKDQFKQFFDTMEDIQRQEKCATLPLEVIYY